MWQHGIGMGGMWIGWILALAILVLLIWIIVRAASGSQGTPRQESAAEILDRRYARGEIDDQQYRRMKEELNAR